jgi:CRP-like cAMP-binding protein
VRALGDVRVLELDADAFRTLGAHDPQAIEEVGVAAMERRPELNQAKDAVGRTEVIDAPTSFLTRMKRFLGIG